MPTTYAARNHLGTNDYEPLDWGPAKHNPEHPLHRDSPRAGLDLRDAADERPDDN